MTSPATEVPDRVAVVVLVAVWLQLLESLLVVRSFGRPQAKPLGAVTELPIVTTTVHVPLVAE